LTHETKIITLKFNDNSMNTIIKNYNLQIKKFQKIESNASMDEIHDKRVILRRIFPILAAFKINPSKVKNGEKAFKLFGKLRDIQVQILKLESTDQTPEILEYIAALRDGEHEFKEKVHKFCKKKELEFPTIKKKFKFNKSRIIEKTGKSLTKLIDRIQSRSIDDAEDIHKIRIEFKKFRYKVEILSYIENIDESKLEMLKIYQDKLGEIQDYEVLINGIKKYCKKRKTDYTEMTELFEHDQNTLIENFDNQIELFIAVCKDVLVFNKQVESSEVVVPVTENKELLQDQPVIDINGEASTDEQVVKIIDSLVTKNEKAVKNAKTVVIEKNKVSKKNNPDSLNISKPNIKQKRVIKNAVPLDSDQKDLN